jgi:hypothetical protein
LVENGNLLLPEVELAARMMTPEEIDFTKSAPTPIDQVTKLIEQVTPFIKRQTNPA